MRSFFRTTIEPQCAYCAQGILASDGRAVFCRHAGAVSPGYSCRRFRYDPLRREPRRQAPLPQYTPEDFTL